MKGSYILIIKLAKNKRITVGKRLIDFNKGYYAYVGSAMNNLDKRISRHKSKKKKFHWHIDYFLKYGKIIEVIKFESDKKIECKLSKKVSKLANDFVKGFGCSDCRCKSQANLQKRRK